MLLPAKYQARAAVAACFALAMITVASLYAQNSGAPDDAAFEVASVKPSESLSTRGGYGTRAGGVFYATNTSVLTLVRLAYGVQELQIDKAPWWIASERFDIEARAGRECAASSPTAAPASLAPMLRNLLQDRFAFEAKWEKRRATVLALVREGTAPGHRLTPSAANCVTTGNQPPSPDQKCGFFMRPGLITAANMSMGELAAILSQQAGTRIVDKTELPGRFDIKLEFRPEDIAALTAALTDTPSLAVALKEQLGLTLNRQEDDVDVLVIARVEHPTPN